MLKAKLLKAVALGLCLSALYSGVAYAQSEGASSPAYGGKAETQDNALLEKQKEIDIYLFKEHYEEIADKGIEIVYTGVAETHVEIGIADFSEKKADYLYELFGRDIVKVVSTDDAQLYTITTVEEPSLVTEPDVTAPDDMAPDYMPKDTSDGDIPISNDDIKEEIYTTMDLPMDAPLLTDDEVDQEAADLAADSVVADVEAGEGTTNLEDSELMYHTTVADVTEDGQEVQLVTTRDDKSGKEESGLSTPAIILIIAGGAAVVGGAVIVSTKKKKEN